VTKPYTQRALIGGLGENYIKDIRELREQLIKVMTLDESTIDVVSIRTEVNIATLTEFLRGSSFYRSALLQGKPKSKLVPKDNISFKTYQRIKSYVDKRRKYLGI
jgi:hypothetical protein